jgi:hypothetical protein
MSGEPKHLSKLVSEGGVARLQREAKRRQKETLRLRALLPAEEQTHVVSAVTDHTGELVLVMDSPVWAARARYCLGDTRVRIRVSPQTGER